MKITVNLEHKKYDILIKQDILKDINEYIDIKNRKILILTDDGVPKEYKDIVYNQCSNAFIYTIKAGETSKSLTSHQSIMEFMLEHKFTRKDLVIALGGGVVGDLGGFVASSYMRGVAFVQIPTTTLSQIDSSIGGKTAVNLGKVKNIVGAFYHPDIVFIDINTLKTLSKRNFYAGLVEALKAGLIYDAEIFDLFLEDNFEDKLETIIYKSLLVKKDVVEQDEKEQNLRKILNLGHTLGHGFESFYNFKYLHGECVAFGMLPMIKDDKIRSQVLNILNKMDITIPTDFDVDKVFEVVTMDKKSDGTSITIITIEEIGTAKLELVETITLLDMLKGI